MDGIYQLTLQCTVNTVSGLLAAVLLISVPVALFLSWLTVVAYRRAISSAMRRRAPGAGETQTVRALPLVSERDVQSRLKLEVIDADSLQTDTENSAHARRGLRALIRRYAVAGLVHAAVVSMLTLLFANTYNGPVQLASVVYLYLWPIVPSVILIAVDQRRTRWLLLGGYFAGLVAMDVLSSRFGLGGHNDVGALIQVWLVWMAPPSVLLLLLSNRAWRSVGLPAYLIANGLVLGWILSQQVVGCLTLTTGQISLWLVWRWPVLILALLLILLLCLWILKRIAKAYERKRISDQSYTLASWWLVITLVEVVIQFDTTETASMSFFLAWVLFLIIVRQPAKAQLTPPKSLLLLRVFGHRVRSRTLLDNLGQRWRQIGPINLIGAPDVAVTNLEPDDLIRFWLGRAGELFVQDKADLIERLRSLDAQPDPDGRYRLNELFCYDNTWKETVTQLARGADAILMDLRGFGRSNKGCEFELGVLMSEVALSKTLFLVDDTTDLALLQRLLCQLNVVVRTGKVDHGSTKVVRLFKVGKSPSISDSLMRML